jgi:Uncharacterized lipoprotein
MGHTKGWPNLQPLGGLYDMPKTRWLATLGLAVAVSLAGCALGRDEVSLASAPLAAVPAAASKGKSVFVRNVTDDRVFSKSSDSAASPSLESDVDNPEIRNRAITRKYNAYGMALGDVLLEPGQTVTAQVGDTLRQAFQGAGYTIVTAPGGNPAPIIVDVRVKQFWTWRKLGFTAITLIADIETELTIAGPKTQQALIKAHVEDDRVVAAPSATTESLQQALTAYRTEAITKLAALKL